MLSTKAPDHAGRPVLWCFWPVTLDRDYTRDELVAAALEDLDDLARDAGTRIAGPVNFHIIDEPRELEGWEHWPGWLLIATMPDAQTVPQQTAA